MMILRDCPVCGGWLHERLSVLGPNMIVGKNYSPADGLMYVYSCEQPECQLPPYTKYTATYVGNECISALIILDVNDKHYSLSFNKAKNFTEIGLLRPFIIDINENCEGSEFVLDKICTLNYIEPWHDALSAYRIISRIVKIQAFS